MSSQPELQKNPGFLGDVLQFLAQRKKWYLIPVVVVIAVFALLLALGGTAAAPFIYTLF